MFLNREKIEKYKTLKKELEFCEAALNKFGEQYISFVQNTWVTYNGNRERIDSFAHGGGLDKIYISGEAVHIIIDEYEYGKTEIALPVDILYDENWQERLIQIKYAAMEKQALKAQEGRIQAQQRREENEKKEFLRLKEKFEGGGLR